MSASSMNHDIFPTMSHKVHLLTKHYYKPLSNDVKLWSTAYLYMCTNTRTHIHMRTHTYSIHTYTDTIEKRKSFFFYLCWCYQMAMSTPLNDTYVTWCNRISVRMLLYLVIIKWCTNLNTRRTNTTVQLQCMHLDCVFRTYWQTIRTCN